MVHRDLLCPEATICTTVDNYSAYCALLSVEQLLSHLSIPDETYQSVKVKAKVSYLGMLQDGKPHH